MASAAWQIYQFIFNAACTQKKSPEEKDQFSSFRSRLSSLLSAPAPPRSLRPLPFPFSFLPKLLLSPSPAVEMGKDKWKIEKEILEGGKRARGEGLRVKGWGFMVWESVTETEENIANSTFHNIWSIIGWVHQRIETDNFCCWLLRVNKASSVTWMNAHIQRWAWEILCDRGNSGCSHRCCVSDLQLSQLCLFLLHTITNPVKIDFNFAQQLHHPHFTLELSLILIICQTIFSVFHLRFSGSKKQWLLLPSLNSACERTTRLLWQHAKKDRCSSASCCIIYVQTSMLLCLFRPTILSSMSHVLHFTNKVNNRHKAPSLIWW